MLMFAVIYSAKVPIEREREYQQAWHRVAQYFIAECGALGSCLHKGEDGLWYAYSRWPDKKPEIKFGYKKKSQQIYP
jgi:hypothetical protein